MNRRLFLLTVVLLACLALVAGPAAAQTAAPAGAESEPNDTLAQATPVALGETTAHNNSAADVDWFKLNLTAGQSLHALVTVGCGEADLYFHLGVYNAAGQPLVVNEGYNPGKAVIDEVIIPTTGVYYVRVTDPGLFDEVTGPYSLFLQLNPPGEPFDDPADATPLAFGQTLTASYDWPDDHDYFAFDGRAGDLVTIRLAATPAVTSLVDFRLSGPDPDLWLMADQYTTSVSVMTAILPDTGRYVIMTWGPSYGCDIRPYPTPHNYQVSLKREGLYVTGLAAGSAAGVPFGPNDIMGRNATGQWRKVFDGEDVGLTKPLNAFERLADGSYLMSIKAAQTLPELGAVKPQDVVRFTPTALGANTAGSFSWYLRGATVGLTTAGEIIDALGLAPNGHLLVSMQGAAGVPAAAGGTLAVADESIIEYQPGAGWASYFDKNNWDSPYVHTYRSFANEDVNALTRLTDGAALNTYNNDILFTLNSDYRFQYESVRYYVHKGDVMGFNFDWGVYGGMKFAADFRSTLGFPKPIVNLSIGPVWSE